MGTDKTIQPPEGAFKYQWLATQLERYIQQQLKPGDKLPSIRQLVKQFGLSKNTVIQALHELEAKALLDAQPKRGFVVKAIKDSRPPTEPKFDNIQPSKVSVPELLQDVIVRGAAFDIRPSAKPTPLPNLLTKLHRNINRSARTQVSRKSLYYDDPQGYYPLRQQIAEHYHARNLRASADRIGITSGCQHALFLALMATCKSGDNVVIESPGFYGVIQLLDKLGLHAIEIPSHSAQGIDIDVLQSALKRYNVAACVISPSFSTPSGACLSVSAKQTLMTLANQYDFAIIEDDIYADLSFGQTLSPIKSLDTENRVILCSSFSKSLSRDLRLGWIMGARWHKDIVRLGVISHIANSLAVQEGLHTFLRDGDFKRYLNQIRKQLAIQKNQMVGALQRFWGDNIRYSNPNGGLSLWVEFTSPIDSLRLYEQALTHQILITPGTLFSVERDFSNFMRLSFCHPTIGQRETALQQLRALSQHAKTT